MKAPFYDGESGFIPIIAYGGPAVPDCSACGSGFRSNDVTTSAEKRPCQKSGAGQPMFSFSTIMMKSCEHKKEMVIPLAVL